MTSEITTRAQIIELLRTFKNENAEKYGILSRVLPNSLHEAEVQGSGASYLVEFFDLVFGERDLPGPRTLLLAQVSTTICRVPSWVPS